MKNIILYFQVLTIAFCTFFSIQASAISEKIEDLKGQLKELKMKEPPKRIVTLSISGAEVLSVLGLKSIGIPLPNSGQFPEYLMEDLKDVERVGSLAQPSLERILVLKPDLIILDRFFEDQRDLLDKLRKIAPVVYFRADNYKETMEQVRVFGKFFKKEKEADEFINQFNASLETTRKSAQKHLNSTVLALYIANNSIWAWTEKSFLSSLFSEINVDYAYKGKGSKKYSDMIEVNNEKILEIDPDYILVLQDPGKNDVAFLSKSPIWKNLKAVKRSHIITVNRDIWSRSRGPLSAESIVNRIGSIIK